MHNIALLRAIECRGVTFQSSTEIKEYEEYALYYNDSKPVNARGRCTPPLPPALVFAL